MQAQLIFNLPEDNEEFQDAINGSKFGTLIWDFDQYLRHQIKYAPDDAPEDAYKAYVEIREKLHEMLTENNLSIE